MQLFRLIAFFLFLQYCTINEALARSTANVINPQTQLKEISQICLLSPIDCLKNIDDVLLSTSQGSRTYFEILQYKFEALFNLKRRETLNQETKKWFNKDNIPLTFQITNAIYYAKTSWELGKEGEGQEAYLYAKSILEQVNREFPSPLRLVQFANLQMQLKEFDEAYELMLSLANKYPNNPDTRFMVELHGNLGHAANQLGKTNQALIHWQDTVKWVMLLNNKQQIAVVLFNLADIYEQLEQYSSAKQNFLDASNYAQAAGDHIKMNQSLFRLLKVKLLTEDICENTKLIHSIETNYLPKKLLSRFNELSQQFDACKSKETDF